MSNRNLRSFERKKFRMKSAWEEAPQLKPPCSSLIFSFFSFVLIFFQLWWTASPSFHWMSHQSGRLDGFSLHLINPESCLALDAIAAAALFVKIGFLELCGPTFLVEFLCAYDARMFQHVYILFLIFLSHQRVFRKEHQLVYFWPSGSFNNLNTSSLKLLMCVI